MRLDEAPDDYSDFVDAKMVELERANGVGYEDTIESNKDYYYCFRAINAHGYPSNPSPVMHLNVYDDGDIHIGEVKPYTFASDLPSKPSIDPMLSRGILSVALSEDQSIAGGYDPTKIKTSKRPFGKITIRRSGSK